MLLQFIVRNPMLQQFAEWYPLLWYFYKGIQCFRSTSDLRSFHCGLGRLLWRAATFVISTAALADFCGIPHFVKPFCSTSVFLIKARIGILMCFCVRDYACFGGDTLRSWMLRSFAIFTRCNLFLGETLLHWFEVWLHASAPLKNLAPLTSSGFPQLGKGVQCFCKEKFYFYR